MTDAQSFLRALGDLEQAIDDNLDRSRLMQRRIRQIRRELERGRSVREVVEAEKEPLVVSLITASARALEDAGAQVRRSEARALHHEGMTMDAIAAKFGVTRQRVSSLLRDARRDSR